MKTVLSKAVQGVGWGLLSALGTRVLSLFGTLILTRFIAPEVQGAVMAAYIYVLTPHWVTVPLVQYVVAHPRADASDVFHVTVLHLALGAIMLFGAWLGAPLAASWLGAPAMVRYVPGFACALGLERIGVLVERVMARDLRFRAIALARGASELAYTSTALIAAVEGASGEAIVFGNIARGIVHCAVVMYVCPLSAWLSATRLQPAMFREVLRYGLPLSGQYLAVIASRRWDNLAITWLFGTGAAGLYNLAYNLADLPTVQVAEQFGDVLMPSLAHMQADERRAAIVKASGVMAIVVFPLGVGLAVIAPSLERLFSESWRGVGAMLGVLATMAVVRPVAVSIAGPYLQVAHRTRISMVLALVHVMVAAGLLLTLGRMGPLWACASLPLSYAVYTGLSLLALSHYEGVRSWDLLVRCMRALGACIPMAMAAHLAGKLAHAKQWALGFELAAEVLVGGVVYVAAALVVARPIYDELIALVRSSRRQTG